MGLFSRFAPKRRAASVVLRDDTLTMVEPESLHSCENGIDPTGLVEFSQSLHDGEIHCAARTCSCSTVKLQLRLNGKVLATTPASETASLTLPVRERGRYQVVSIVVTSSGEPRPSRAHDYIDHLPVSVAAFGEASAAWLERADLPSVEIVRRDASQADSQPTTDIAIIDLVEVAQRYIQEHPGAIARYDNIATINELRELREADKPLDQMTERAVDLVSILAGRYGRARTLVLAPTFAPHVGQSHLTFALEEIEHSLRESDLARILPLPRRTSLLLESDSDDTVIWSEVSDVARDQVLGGLSEPDIIVELSGSELLAYVANEHPSGASLRFDLMRDGTRVETTHNPPGGRRTWALKDAGIYSVRVFVTWLGKQVRRVSRTVEYFDDEFERRYQGWLAAPPASALLGAGRLSFDPATEPYADIAVLAMRGRGRDMSRVISRAAELGLRHHESASYGEVRAITLSNVSSVETSDGSALFGGVAVMDERWIVGARDLDRSIEGAALWSGVGAYAVVTRDARQLRISRDLFQFCGIFYYEDDDVLIAATSYHLLCELLVKYRGDLEIDCAKIIGSLGAVGQFGQQNYSFEMDVRGTRQLPVSVDLAVSSDGWSFARNAVGEILQDRLPFHRELYERVLHSAVTGLERAMACVTADDRYDEFIVDLTGGLDSRSVYGLITSQADRRRVSIFTSDRWGDDGKRDVEIATALNRLYGFRYTSGRRGRSRTVDLVVDDHNLRSRNLGTYYAWKHGMSITEGSTALEFRGACGEVAWRPYIAPRITGSSQAWRGDHQDAVEAMAQGYLHALPVDYEKGHRGFLERIAEAMESFDGLDPLEAIDRHYMAFRHGVHFQFGVHWSRGIPIWTPLQSREMLALHHWMFPVFLTEKLHLDANYRINPLLSNFPYDKPWRNREVHRIRDTLVAGDRRFDGLAVDTTPDLDTWRDALQANRRAENTPQAPVASQGNAPSSGSVSTERLRDAFLSNLRELIALYPTIGEAVGRALYHYVERNPTSTFAIRLLYCKVTSALDQARIIASARPDVLRVRHEPT